MDESGTSNQPILTVCGVMADADGHVRYIEEHLQQLQKRLAPELGPDFVFHAADIWGGNGFFKDRQNDWPFSRRIILLEEISKVPKIFDVPISLGLVVKKDVVPVTPEPLTPFALGKVHHALAFTECCVGVEIAMRSALPGEICMLIVEDCENMRDDLTDMHELIRDPKRVKEAQLEGGIYPFVHVKEGILFANKRQSKLLQLADCCAYVTRAFLTESVDPRRSHIAAMYAQIEPQLLQKQGPDGHLMLKNIKPGGEGSDAKR